VKNTRRRCYRARFWRARRRRGHEATASSAGCYFGVSFNSLLVCGVFGLTVGVPLSVNT
jgi:hypothetical protein